MVAEKKRRSTREDWLDTGLELLRDSGDQGLTVDALCARMKRTKGSFYHHFGDRPGFVARLLEHWERRFTGRIIADLEPLADPVVRLRALGERTVREVDLRLERTIRVWAEREPAARAVVERVDGEREGYLRRLFEEALGDPRRARMAARAHMALLVGTEMLYQDLSQRELRELNAFLDRLGFDSPRSTNDPRPIKKAKP